MGKAGRVTVGYRYHMTLLMGIGRGPVDEVCQIRAGDRDAYVGAIRDAAGSVQAEVRSPGQFSELYIVNTMVAVNDRVETGQELFWLYTNPAPEGGYAPIRVFAPAPGRVTAVTAPTMGYPIAPNTLLATIETGGVYIDEPELFGGDNGEGGLRGDLFVMPGRRDQGVNGWLQALIGRAIPAMRGVFCLAFDGMVCAMNPYPKPWKFRVRRTERGWQEDKDPWYPEKCTIWVGADGKRTTSGAFWQGNGDLNKIQSMNPAHILYECVTNREWGRGLPVALINVDSFVRAADTLWDEEFGLCIRWNRQDTIDAFVQQILDHIGGALYPDRATGQITLKLIRDDYDPERIPLLTYENGLLEITESRATSLTSSVNEIIVSWTDPIKNEKRQTRVQNLAALQSAGAIYSDTRDYFGAPTAALANRLAQRDLRTQAPGLRRVTLKADRRLWNVPPAGVFRIQDPFRGIGNMILRVGKIEDGQFDDGAIQITAVQDVFTMPLSAFVTPQPPDWTPGNPEPIPANFTVFEIPYALLRGTLSAADFEQIDEDSAYLGVVAAKPSDNTINYRLATRAAGELNFEVRGGGQFAAYGEAEGPLAG